MNYNMKDLVTGALRLTRATEMALGEAGRKEVRDNLVTDVAARADRVISERILEYFKLSGLPCIFLDEEMYGATGSIRLSENPEYTVAFDDVDGTYNNMRGRGILPATTIVQVFDSPKPTYRDTLAAGVMDLRTGKIWYAERGKGVEFDDKPANTSGETDVHPKTFVILDGAGKDIMPYRRLYKAAWVRDFGTSGLEFAGLVGGGENNSSMFDAFVHPGNKAHEIPAGFLFLKEAGGFLACMDSGQPQPFDDIVYDFNSKHKIVAAATAELGRKVIELIDW